MKVKRLGVALALVAAAPAVLAPRLVATVHAQAAASDTAEYPDVPKNHWAYAAINRLSQAGIIEGLPGGVYGGSKAMTRYEFAVAIARLLDKQGAGGVGPAGAPGIQGPPGPQGEVGPKGGVDMTRAEVNDLITALRHEFADELSRLGVRVDALETRVSNLENRTPAPPRLTITPSFLYRMGAANYLTNQSGGGVLGNGRSLFTGAGAPGATPRTSVFSNKNFIAGKFSYTDFELRLTDRVSDRLSVNAALRDLSGASEDAWAGGSDGNTLQLREAFADADLGDAHILGAKNFNVAFGRQHTKIAQGLLYDNDLAPTDQINSHFQIGPVNLTAILGTVNNAPQFGLIGLANPNPYYTQGAARYFSLGGVTTGGASAGVGFPTSGALLAAPTTFREDNESLLHAGFNLFRIAGNPVQLGLTSQFDGVEQYRADSFDLSIPLFNRTVGFEYVRERTYDDGTSTADASGGRPHAYNVTVPILRTRVLDLNGAYGQASNQFQYSLSSAANPFARTYGEALFDRPLALGAPMVGNVGGVATELAAKKAYDFNGTLRVIRRLPLDFRYYKATGSNGINLGKVYTIGSTVNISQGLDLEMKYGQYDSQAPGVARLKYIRFGANVGF